MPVTAPVIGAVGSIAGAAISKPKGAKDPNAYLQPYLKDAAGQAQQLYSQGGPSLWNDSTVAGMSDATSGALSGIINRAQAGSPLIQAAQGAVQNGLNQQISSGYGDAQNPYASAVDAGSGANPYATSENPFGGASNPFLDATYNQAFGKAMQSVESQYARGGRNIGASQPVAGDIASSLASQIYAPAYENERNRQLSYGQQQLGIGANSFENAQSRQLQSNLAAQNIGAQGYENAQARQLADINSQRQYQHGLLGFASPLAAQDYFDLARQQQAGQTMDAYNQALLSDQVSRYNQQAQQPYLNYQNYLNSLTGLAGKAGQTQQPVQSPNYLSAGLGGALLGSQLFGGGGNNVNTDLISSWNQSITPSLWGGA